MFFLLQLWWDRTWLVAHKIRELVYFEFAGAVGVVLCEEASPHLAAVCGASHDFLPVLLAGIP